MFDRENPTIEVARGVKSEGQPSVQTNPLEMTPVLAGW